MAVDQFILTIRKGKGSTNSMVGKIIRMAREALNMKQIPFAEQICIPQSMVSELETGKKQTQPELLEHIARTTDDTLLLLVVCARHFIKAIELAGLLITNRDKRQGMLL